MPRMRSALAGDKPPARVAGGFVVFVADNRSGAVPIRPTRAELSALWSLVPFDLEEPIFVVEFGPRHLLTILDKDMRLTWIDDFAGATMRPGKGLVWE